MAPLNAVEQTPLVSRLNELQDSLRTLQESVRHPQNAPLSTTSETATKIARLLSSKPETLRELEPLLRQAAQAHQELPRLLINPTALDKIMSRIEALKRDLSTSSTAAAMEKSLQQRIDKILETNICTPTQLEALSVQINGSPQSPANGSEKCVRVSVFDAAKVLQSVRIAGKTGRAVGCVAGVIAGLAVGILTVSPSRGKKICATITRTTTQAGMRAGAYIGIKWTKDIEGTVSVDNFFTKESWTQDIPKGHGLNAFTCPITSKLPQVPVAAPDKTVYEQGEIEDHLDREWTQVTDQGVPPKRADLSRINPKKGRPFTTRDLRYASDFVLKLTRKLIAIEKTDSQQETLTRWINHYRSLDRCVRAQIAAQLVINLEHAQATDSEHETVARGLKRHWRVDRFSV